MSLLDEIILICFWGIANGGSVRPSVCLFDNCSNTLEPRLNGLRYRTYFVPHHRVMFLISWGQISWYWVYGFIRKLQCWRRVPRHCRNSKFDQ